MKEITKIAARQDANFKLTPSSSNETSINLSNEIADFIANDSGKIVFKIYKEDLIKAISTLCLIPTIFLKKNIEPATASEILSKLYKQLIAQFGDSSYSYYTINIFKRDDGRSYLNELKSPNGFNFRSFLIERFSEIRFIKEDNGNLSLRLNTYLPDTILDSKAIQESGINYLDEPLQIIFYGAPGTGKSFKIDNMTNDSNTIRTTFHPDTDYSTFVGAYKPTMRDEKLTHTSSDGIVRYVKTDDKSVDKHPGSESKIVYEFIPQAFLSAYVEAWKRYKDNKPFFLIIEEINRGNCAQIFGDLFQLLDRNTAGSSTYAIRADKDIAKFLCDGDEGFKSLTDEEREAISNFKLKKGNNQLVSLGAEILSGTKLLLPPNLYIWATMNTSDQSLFPIDSAFKRRWDWKYIKIKEGKTPDGVSLDWKIDVKDNAGEQISWWAFIKQINRIIASMTSSSDKQLGYFFAKANKDGVIDEKTLVGKVMFYLWNDVFKDYGFEDASLFRYKDENNVDHDLTFPDFYSDEEDENGDEKINTARLTEFVNKAMAWKSSNDEAK